MDWRFSLAELSRLRWSLSLAKTNGLALAYGDVDVQVWNRFCTRHPTYFGVLVPTLNPYIPPQAGLESNDPLDYQEMNFWGVSGRIGRLRYIAYAGGAYLVVLLVGVALGAVFGRIGSAQFGNYLGLIGIPYFFYSISLGIRRSHDMDCSGWTLLWCLIPFVALIWLFKAGTAGRNRFGPPPPPNPLGVTLLALLFPILGAIGIVAAIALPFFLGYSNPAKVVLAG